MAEGGDNAGLPAASLRAEPVPSQRISRGHTLSQRGQALGLVIPAPDVTPTPVASSPVQTPRVRYRTWPRCGIVHTHTQRKRPTPRGDMPVSSRSRVESGLFVRPLVLASCGVSPRSGLRSQQTVKQLPVIVAHVRQLPIPRPDPGPSLASRPREERNPLVKMPRNARFQAWNPSSETSMEYAWQSLMNA